MKLTADTYMTEPSDAPAGLTPIAMEHGRLVENACEAAGVTYWTGFFPYLLCSSRPGRRVLIEEAEGSLLVYLLRSAGDWSELSLFFPPLPFSATALRRAEGRMEAVNQSRSRNIEWIGENAALDVVRQGYAISLRASEYVYDQTAVAEATGPDFSRIRRNVNGASRIPGLLMRPYTAAQHEPCSDLLRQWHVHIKAIEKEIKKRDVVVNGFTFARRCLDMAPQFSRDQLWGEIAEIEGEIGGFAFGGPISRSWGNVCIVITDHAFSGLPYLLRHRLISAFPNLSYFNDSTASGRAGLEQLKRLFRPVEMVNVYRGRHDATS